MSAEERPVVPQIEEMRKLLPAFTPALYSLGVLPPVADSAKSRAIALEITKEYRAKNGEPYHHVATYDDAGKFTGYRLFDRETGQEIEGSQ